MVCRIPRLVAQVVNVRSAGALRGCGLTFPLFLGILTNL